MHIFNDRHPGASLTALLGQRAGPALRQDYATLAEALADTDELKSLGEILGHALGIEATHEADAAGHAAAVMEATKDLLRAHGWHSRAWH